MTNEDFASLAAHEAYERALKAYTVACYAAKGEGCGLTGTQRALLGSALLEAFDGFEQAVVDMARASDLLARMAPYTVRPREVEGWSLLADELDRFLTEVLGDAP